MLISTFKAGMSNLCIKDIPKEHFTYQVECVEFEHS